MLIASAPALLGAQQAQGTIRGRVTSSGSGQGLGNAQVFVAGTSLGGLTGVDGSYSIAAVPAGAQVVRVRLIGYQPTEKPVTVTGGGSVTLDFTLTQSAISLDEVVVTGTGGSARKREVGNSIGQIKVSETPEVPTNVSNMLAGRLAGVTVGGGTGNSGGGAAIRLRGTTSVALTNQPLIFIDGVRTRSDEYPRNGIFTGTTQRGANVYGSPLNDINPDDIERIEVVKGAAAATLYGTDAAAGVIQIFTKRGASGAAKWNVTANTGFSTLQKFGTDSAPLLFMDPPSCATPPPTGRARRRSALAPRTTPCATVRRCRCRVGRGTTCATCCPARPTTRTACCPTTRTGSTSCGPTWTSRRSRTSR
jgi:TonB-dependent SusC/RagA subfamily outer membrane receptor